MLTVVALLLLPFVFGMSVYRAYHLPQVLLSRAQRLNLKHPLVAAIALGATYVALVGYTVFVLYTAARMVLSPPKTIQELFSVAAVCVAYPLVYLVFEWVLFYSVRSGVAR
jgi:hypothetical protein